ncbi:MAG TPA: phosphoribosylglycinamide formyltransferase [Alphaproteobacteria bacterium]|nr:phosphoribosylglycinamide formyltransferase [Alphaproteobacteria bacterium]
MARLKLGILISGRGSNLQALLRACAEPGFPAEIALVVSNRAAAPGLEFAREAGIPTAVVPLSAHGGDRDAADAAMTALLRAAGVELVCLAGFMRLLTPGFVEGWRDRLINIHPSLLPAFKGLDTHRRALEAGVRITGCTVHYVRLAMDEGPILVQAAVPVEDGDDEASLGARILAAEHRCYPLAVRLIAEGRVRVEGERARIEAPAPATALVNPAP